MSLKSPPTFLHFCSLFILPLLFSLECKLREEKIKMEFFDEIFLSLITIVFAFLIVKIASVTAAADRSRDYARSIEVREEISEAVDLVKELDEMVKIGENDDDDEDNELVEFELQEEEKGEEMRCRAVDLVMEESAKKLEEAVKIGGDDAELVKLELQEEENGKEKRSQVLDSVIEEYVKKLDETAKIGEDDYGLVSFDLQEEENREEMKSQEADVVIEEAVKNLDEPVEIWEGDAEFVKFVLQEEEKKSQAVDLVIEESVKELDEPVRIGHGDAKLVIYDLQHEANREEKKSQMVDLVIEETAEQFQEPAQIDENNAELVKFDLQDEENREEKKSQLVDLVIEVSVKEFDELLKIREDDPKLIKFDLQEEEKISQPLNLAIEESVKGLEETVKTVEDDTELVNCDLREDKYGEELVKELHESVKSGEDDAELLKEKGPLPEMASSINDEVCELASSTQEEMRKGEIGKGEKSTMDEKEGTLLYGEDEWEGIEKSELEKLFGVAVEYVGSEVGGNALSKLSIDVKKQLYGLHKVATEGPCYEPQPMAMKITARAKWHSWQRLGNMDPEVAMEQYIAVLSESIPGWMGEKPGVDAKLGKGDDAPDKGVCTKEVADQSSFMHGQPTSFEAQRAFEDPSFLEIDKPTSGPNLFAKGLTKTFLFDLLSPTRVTFF